MTYRIHDWRDDSQYPDDALTAAPPKFIETRKKHNYSDEQISTVFWHWEFLRRHPLYQKHWASEGVEYFLMFGVCGTFRPEPKTECPADLFFRYELFHKDSRFPTFIEPHKPWAENATRLKLQYDFLVSSKSAFELFMLSGHVPWPELKGARLRSLSKGKYQELLRVLDALAVGETLTQIARELRSNLPENSLYNAGYRLKKSALDFQAAITGLPRMGSAAIVQTRMLFSLHVCKHIQ